MMDQNNSLTKVLLVFLLLYLFSCSKEFIEPEKHYEDFLEEFILGDTAVIVQKAADWDPHSETPTYNRGYIFTPLVDIRLTEVGGLVAGTGTLSLGRRP